jgi:glycosyltransferase involved in cell wall biosynthesis
LDPLGYSPVDVFIPTYNSEAHLQACISSVMRSLPVKRIVLVDHHSSDGTLEIARRNRCDVVQEEKGLGYARQLSIDLSSTEVFAMVESDLVYDEFDWFKSAINLLKDKVGAVVAYVPRRSSDTRGGYAEFWSRYTPLQSRRHGFSAGSTLFRKEAVSGIRVPYFLNAYEDIFIMREMAKRGWSYKTLEVRGTHHSDFESTVKARWYGANARILYGLEPDDATLLRRHVTLPAMGLVAALGSRRPGIFTWSVAFSANFLLGWSSPAKFSHLRR